MYIYAKGVRRQELPIPWCSDVVMYVKFRSLGIAVMVSNVFGDRNQPFRQHILTLL
jgi:hypothetical protein